MYYIEADKHHEKLSRKDVYLTRGKQYLVQSMQPSFVSKGTMEFMLTNDKGVTKYHHGSWFKKDLVWKGD